eukprot:11289796-Alexandrium_andersonii.AAC.1
MPTVKGLLPREQGVDGKQYLEFGHDEYSKNFDPLWQSGAFDIQTNTEDPPENMGKFPSYRWGSQFP